MRRSTTLEPNKSQAMKRSPYATVAKFMTLAPNAGY